MMSRPVPSHELLTTRQRLLAFHGSTLSAEQALALGEEELGKSLFMQAGVSAHNLAAAGVGPKLLHKLGATQAADLRELGFDSLYLSDSKFCSEANAAYSNKLPTGARMDGTDTRANQDGRGQMKGP